MTLISGIIPTQNFELVRDRIGQILSAEFANQYTLTTNEDINVTVYNDRIVPFDKTDTPCINVVFDSGNYNAKFENKADGSYIYNIDVFCTAATTATETASRKANMQLQKILGMARTILSSSGYRTLEFPMPSLSHVSVRDIKIASLENKQDASTMVMGRLTFMVNCTESVALLSTVPLESSLTSVKLCDSDKGYFWEYSI